MALRDQPYLPLYIQDFLTDEKLNECSAASVGVYIKIMCLMHKSENYGTILLKQKDKQISKQIVIQNDEQIIFFSLKLAKLLPFDFDTIYAALTELIHEKVICFEGDTLVQGRMVKDNEISIKRSLSGKEGGKVTQKNIKESNNFAKANNKANSENEIVSEVVIDIENYISKDIEHLKEYIAGKNFKFSGVEPANWQTEIAKFLSDKRYIVDFSVKNNIPFDDVEKRMVDFVAKLNSKMDYKDFPAMKVHFANSYQFHVVNGGKSKKETSSKGFHEVPKNIDYENLEGAWNQ